MRKNLTLTAVLPGLLALLVSLIAPSVTNAQRRGTYTPGLNATNSGVIPEPGLTYSNIFQLYSFSELKGPNGDTLLVDVNLSVFIDHNVFIWVSKQKVLGGNFVLLADLPVANSSLSLADFGASGGGGGFADSAYQPFGLGWHKKRADFQVGYSFVAPTGRFNDGASDNVGAGRWTHGPSAGQTFYLDEKKGTAISAFESYEFHSDQESTDIHAGQTFNLDYSITQVIPLKKDMSRLLQVGLIGYGQYQTTDHTGPSVNPIIAADTQYRVNALGAAANIILPAKKASLGFKWFKEFSNKSTVEGYSIQISGAITF